MKKRSILLALFSGSLFSRFIIRKISNNKKKNKLQHNQKKITYDIYSYVFLYKKQLIKNITLLLNSLNIKFVIAHGNLIEFERGEYIFRDDDIDIRFDHRDFDKWELFCSEPSNNNKYNLNFDFRFSDIKQQKKNGIQCGLINFENFYNNKEFPELDIHLDLVSSNLKSEVWIKYNIDFDNIRKIKYLDVDTYAPSISDTKMILQKEYGKKYLIPKYKTVITK